MPLIDRRTFLRSSVAAGASAPLLGYLLGAARADDKTFVMKLGTATINEAQHEWCKRFAAIVERDSGGRIRGEVYPGSQLGSIPREIEAAQLGAIQGYVGPPEFLVGVDERYEVLSAPGLIADMAHGIKVASDPELQKLMFSFGTDKGLHAVGLWVSQPSSIISRTPVRHLADLKGKKLRVLAADMQEEMLKRFGASPVPMALGDLLPAIQQGTIDGAVAVATVDVTMKMYDAAKYVTETGQPFVFSMAFISKKWFDSLPGDLQTIINTDAAKLAAEINPWAADFYEAQRKAWTEHGELISLPADEQAQMMKTLTEVSADVAKRKPALAKAYDVVLEVAKRTRP